MQRILIIFATIFVLTYSKPNGQFHRQYKYHSSSSQYKNNELQEKTQDEGFYSQHGDLEGRQDPKTDGYSSHLRYTNPNGEVEDLTQQTENVDLTGLKTRQHGSHHGSHGHRTGSNGFNTGSYGLDGSSSYDSNSGSYGSTAGSYGSTSGSHGLTVGTYELTSGSHGLSSGSHGLSSGSHGLSSGTHGLSSGTHGLSSGTHGLSSGTHGLSSGSHGLSSGNHGLSSGSHGFTSGTYGLTSGTYGLNSGSQGVLDGTYDGTQGGSQAHSSESSYTYSQSHNSGSTTGNSYGGTTNGGSQLYSLEQKLQDDLTHQLQNAFSNNQNQYAGSSASSSTSSFGNSYTTNIDSEADLQKLEEELKRNLTQQLQSQLQKHGGARGSYTYTITTTGSQFQPQKQVTYTTEDIQQLKKHLEDNLHNQLQQNYQRQRDGNTRKYYVVKTYGVTSNLGDITKQLEDNLARQLQDAVRKQHLSSSSYSQTYTTNSEQMNTDLEKLKQELRRNLTQQLQDQLDTTYGTQGNRGSHSYTITSGGKYNQNANYDNQELVDLKKQLEDNLLRQLEKDVQTEYSQTTSHVYSSQTSNQNTGTHGSHYTPTNDNSSPTHITYMRPTINTGSQTSGSSVSTSYDHDSTYRKPSVYNNRRPTTQIYPSINQNVQEPVEAVTYIYNKPKQTDSIRSHTYDEDDTQQVAQHVITVPKRPIGGGYVVYGSQAVKQLPTVINDCEKDLEYEITSQYIQDQIRLYKQIYSLDDDDDVDFNVVLRQIKNDFRKKLDKRIDDELKRTYGEQVQIGTEVYWKPRGSTQQQATINYKLDDFNRLKQDLEDKLYERLTKTVRQEETNYVNHNTHTYTSGNGGQLSKYGTFGESSINYPGGPTHASGSQTNNKKYTFSYTTNTQELDNQLNNLRSDLERQLQQQIQYYKTNAQSNTNTNQYDRSYWNNIQDELRTNYTRQLQSAMQKYGRQGQVGGVSYKITSTNPGFDYNKKIEDFSKQLETDLNRQVTDGLSNYASTQTSYGYGKPKAYTKNGNGGFASSYGHQSSSSWSASSGTHHGGQMLTTFDGHQHTEDCMHDDPTVATVQKPLATSAIINTQKLLTNEQTMNTQQKDSSEESVQTTEDDSSEEKFTQQTVSTNLQQQIQDITGLDQQVNKQTTIPAQSNKFENSEELVQMIMNHHFDDQKLNTHGHQITQQTTSHSQQEESEETQTLEQETDLGQQTIDLGQQTIDLGQQTIDLGQQNMDLGQQTLELGQQTVSVGQKTEDLSQQTEDLGQQTVDLGQQSIDLGQQSLEMGQQTIDLGQQTIDLGQQTLNIGQHTDNDDYSDLTQQTDDDFGQLQFSGHSSQQQIETGQHTLNDDVTQQQISKQLTEQKQDLVQQKQLNEGSSQQIEDLTQQLEGLSQQTVDGLSQFQQKQDSQELTQQVENGFDTLHLQTTANKFHPQVNVNHGGVQHQSSYQSSNSYSSSHSASYSSSHQHSGEVIAKIDEITTAKPGFWKRLGQTIETSYHTAKDKTKSVLHLR